MDKLDKISLLELLSDPLEEARCYNCGHLLETWEYVKNVNTGLMTRLKCRICNETELTAT